MNTKKIELSVDIKATPHQIYDAFLDERKHAEFTGASAEIDPRVGGEFEVWEGSLHGKTTGLLPDKRIVQLWRSNEEDWPEEHFSELTIILKDNGDGTTNLHLSQKGIPEEVVRNVEEGWKSFYFEPLQEYFK